MPGTESDHLHRFAFGTDSDFHRSVIASVAGCHRSVIVPAVGFDALVEL